MDSDPGTSGPDPAPDARLSDAREPLVFTIDVKPDRDRVLVCPAGDVDLAHPRGRATRLPLEIVGVINVLEIEPGRDDGADCSVPG